MLISYNINPHTKSFSLWTNYNLISGFYCIFTYPIFVTLMDPCALPDLGLTGRVAAAAAHGLVKTCPSGYLLCKGHSWVWVTGFLPILSWAYSKISAVILWNANETHAPLNWEGARLHHSRNLLVSNLHHWVFSTVIRQKWCLLSERWS